MAQSDIAGPIGRPLDRVDGPAKVTGRAHYTADIMVPGAAHTAVVGATIPSGRVTAVHAVLASRKLSAVHFD